MTVPLRWEGPLSIQKTLGSVWWNTRPQKYEPPYKTTFLTLGGATVNYGRQTICRKLIRIQPGSRYKITEHRIDDVIS